MNHLSITLSIIVAILLVFCGVGCAPDMDAELQNTANIQPKDNTLEGIISSYADLKRAALVGDLDEQVLSQIPQREAARLRDWYTYTQNNLNDVKEKVQDKIKNNEFSEFSPEEIVDAKRRLSFIYDYPYPLIDYGLAIRVRDIQYYTNSDKITIIYEELISSKTNDLGDPHFSFEQQYHRVVIHNNKIIEDEHIEMWHEDFQFISGISTGNPIITVKSLESDPYALGSNNQFNNDLETLHDHEEFYLPQDQDLYTRTFAINSSNLRSYATNHCRTHYYNQNYPDYSGTTDGGDCTNFVSQCLEAGGLPFRDDPNQTIARRRSWAQYWWFNRQDRSDHSLSWSTVSGLKNHFAQRGNTSTIHWVWEQAHVGDVVFMDFNQNGTWDHACVVTTAKKNLIFGFQLKVSCHTTDHCDKNFYDIASACNNSSNNSPGCWFQIVHMP